ncbi:transcriptional regulator [Leptospira sp. 201903071]|uniref:transcriptional regulator n=1 Tax=Leptospira ainazelensis TaxID=2810034 RepID=UPI001965460F|nr:transcriptional regulator [Leptospira ainazelensis]MBM9500340.1 transcriptional regulator [Leptospira ainazelensis]
MERNDLLEEFEDLMSLALFGEITEEQTTRLNQIVDQDRSLKERYENYIKMQAGLRLHKTALSQSESKHQNLSSSRVSFAEKLFKNRILLLAAIIPLIASIFMIIQSQIFRKPNSVAIRTLGACDAQSIQTTNSIRLDENSFCDVEILRTQGSIHFKIFPNSEVRILHLPKSNDSKESLSIFFEKGGLLLNENVSSSGKTKLYWNGTRIELLGTKVLIEDTKNGRSIKVWNGSASVSSGVRYLLPFLLTPSKNWIQNFGEKNKELLNDIEEIILSNSSLETSPVVFSEDSKIFFVSENDPKAEAEEKIRTELGQIRNILSLGLKKNKTSSLSPEDLEKLEKVSESLGRPDLPDLNSKIREPIPNQKKEIAPVIEKKKESQKEEPVRLGNKTIKLKDGSELKGNLIQYENEYVLEMEGKKKVIKAEDVESISF